MTNELLTVCHSGLPKSGPGPLGSDKYIGTFQLHSYIENFYSKVLPPRRHTTKNVLEIGIWKGGSIWLWEWYFQSAHVWALDRDEFMTKRFAGQERIHAMGVDAYSPEIIAKFQDGFFDLIIDDGPHTVESQCIFIKEYSKKLAPGGLIIVEDIASEEALEAIGQNVPEHLQDKICVYDGTITDSRYDSRILYIQT